MEDNEFNKLRNDFKKLRVDQTKRHSGNKLFGPKFHSTRSPKHLSSSSCSSSHLIKPARLTHAWNHLPITKPPLESPNFSSTHTFGDDTSTELRDFSTLSLGAKAAKTRQDTIKYDGTFRNPSPTPFVPNTQPERTQSEMSCSQQARIDTDITVDELAGYLDNMLHLPKKMSYMAEMMYT